MHSRLRTQPSLFSCSLVSLDCRARVQTATEEGCPEDWVPYSELKDMRVFARYKETDEYAKCYAAFIDASRAEARAHQRRRRG